LAPGFLCRLGPKPSARVNKRESWRLGSIGFSLVPPPRPARMGFARFGASAPILHFAFCVLHSNGLLCLSWIPHSSLCTLHLSVGYRSEKLRRTPGVGAADGWRRKVFSDPEVMSSLMIQLRSAKVPGSQASPRLAGSHIRNTLAKVRSALSSAVRIRRSRGFHAKQISRPKLFNGAACTSFMSA